MGETIGQKGWDRRQAESVVIQLLVRGKSAWDLIRAAQVVARLRLPMN